MSNRAITYRISSTLFNGIKKMFSSRYPSPAPFLLIPATAFPFACSAFALSAGWLAGFCVIYTTTLPVKYNSRSEEASVFVGIRIGVNRYVTFVCRTYGRLRMWAGL